MNTATINISLPVSMYKDAKLVSKEEGYSSISELIRCALRKILYPSGLTVNGFTPEFENMVLEAAKEPINESSAWNSTNDVDAYFKKLKARNK
ncbi:MAG: hypothetical protein UR39_C0001G0027 [Candidatus Woesebacteria bacterium GW2011_GWA1_33_30]|uniref:Uncharacterized protein n=1 Tax=Candidatus Woesebacteria bacterium GW2011_GWA2_33_28 TaxID=1618561 RepID=A0A0G0CXY3_9BACT|nr:MAG: hypothetical protein UR38_C0001G0028 [Candidatus Woesebacteria bacterium GW2011_GWA2_33_28]KKP48994.1 MAG: hypothetical protein UR39_C0001G0027 [Candidatus Woesebacteria bacterium GW2011_GWA1_33_30]KKP49898.1 MAG: hypothetical protein UR40_C0003G0070 [Microgenomates group bacterium GW2011_GWC1_33_32]KKP52586.1 MAG: hypothetical protein UR44_C0001G0028 [Candidatus Woesebacteria bacterium GW2011_GWB1_33_38]KKP55770.1 MAG: hypothetical protein UR48_C0051G0004 [Microgenomates group bacteriu